jgi:hypothetical protein
MAEESPTAPSPDRSPAGEQPVPEKQGEHGATPALAQQRPEHVPASQPAPADTKTESAEGWKQEKPDGEAKPAAETTPTPNDTKN